MQFEILSETHTLSESRGEGSDEVHQSSILSETATMSKASGESSDTDNDDTSIRATWAPGNRRPLHFRKAVPISDELPPLRYDPTLSMSVDDTGVALVATGHLSETMTHTATRSEHDDSDR